MKQPRVTRQGCGIAAHADHPRYACRRDLCDLGGGAGEWRIQDHSGETLQLFGLQWLRCEVALLYLNATREVGLDPRALPPRDRFRYWYVTIAHARVDSPEATQAGDRLGEKLQAHGYLIGPAPGVPPSQSTTQA